MKNIEEIIYALDENVDADFWIKELKEWRDQALKARDEEWRENGLELFKNLKKEAEITSEPVFLHECDEQIKHFEIIKDH